jgi:hypothetical protein
MASLVQGLIECRLTPAEPRAPSSQARSTLRVLSSPGTVIAYANGLAAFAFALP